MKKLQKEFSEGAGEILLIAFGMLRTRRWRF
jgi:hypothetical protein